MSLQHKNLPHFLILNQISTLPVDIPQVFYIYSHITSHCRILSQLHNMHQATLPVEIPQDFQLHSHLTCHWRRLFWIQLMHQLTLPFEIHPVFLSHNQPYCSRNPSKMLKWPFALSLTAFLMHLNPHSSNWSH